MDGSPSWGMPFVAGGVKKVSNQTWSAIKKIAGVVLANIKKITGVSTIMLLPFILAGQAKIADSTFYSVREYRVFETHLVVYDNGKTVTEETPVTDSKKVSGVVAKEFERIALAHYRQASAIFSSKKVFDGLCSENKGFLKASQISPFDSLSIAICRLLGDTVILDGKMATIDGRAMICDGKSYQVTAYCFPWVRLTLLDDVTDFYLVGDGEYISLSGRTLKLKGKGKN
jgi:hypothetical protein